MEKKDAHLIHAVTPQQRQTRPYNCKAYTTTTIDSDDDDLSSESELEATYSSNRYDSRHKRSSTVYQGVRTDLIRKNVQISCPDERHLLDFYTKLRMAMIQAGIFYILRVRGLLEDFGCFKMLLELLLIKNYSYFNFYCEKIIFI